MPVGHCQSDIPILAIATDDYRGRNAVACRLVPKGEWKKKFKSKWGG